MHSPILYNFDSIAMISLIIFAVLQLRRIKLCRGQLFSNIVKIMLFISDVQYYIPVNCARQQVVYNYLRLQERL